MQKKKKRKTAQSAAGAHTHTKRKQKKIDTATLNTQKLKSTGQKHTTERLRKN
jgi:hypothetical protein